MTRVVAVTIAVAGCLLWAQNGIAATTIPGANYSADATWTAAGSPYILTGNVSVGANATLTIEPGVVVKLSGQFRTMFVNGRVNAIGASENRITITSIQDDSIGGDSGGDGATTGAPGQWYALNFNSTNPRLSQLHYVDIRYGGYGSAEWNYGAVSATGGSTHVQINNARITDNQMSGIKVGSNADVRVTSSEILRNGNGVSANQGFVSVGANTLVKNNRVDGLWFNFTSSYTGPASRMMNSDSSHNGRDGVRIQTSSDLTAGYWPNGNQNNIYANGGKQLSSLFTKRVVDWKDNFWGTNVYFYNNPAPPICEQNSPFAQGKLAYTGSTASPPDGPISSATYYVPRPWPQTGVICGYDRFDIGPADFSTTYIYNSLVDYGAGFSTSYYSYKESSCASYSDAITMIFYGFATLDRSLNHVQSHASWEEPTFGGGNQYFLSHGVCGNFEGERGSCCVTTNRWHIRARRTEEDDPMLGMTTASTPHHEDVILQGTEPDVCHAIDKGSAESGINSGFDQGRDELIGKFGGSNHSYYLMYKGNTQTIQQCDDDYAGSNGWVAFVYVPETSH